MTTVTNLYISYVFSGITAEKITDVIQNYELLGTVDRVDLVPAKNQSAGKAHNMAFVHMRTWFNNEHAQKTLKAIRAGEKHKIYYESFTKTTTGREPFWTVIQNTKAKPYPMVRFERERDPVSPSMPPLIPIEEEVLTPLGEVALNVDDIVTPPRNTLPPPMCPPRLVRQNACYALPITRNTSSTSTVYEGDSQPRCLDNEFAMCDEDTDLVDADYVASIETENAKLHAHIRKMMWDMDRERYASASYYITDDQLTFAQLEQKYGALMYNRDHGDFTDVYGFVRRIQHPRHHYGNEHLALHMHNWHTGNITEDSMGDFDRDIHMRALRIAL